ncbi:MAG: hypothetical protein JWM64_2220 [Frankiales bacterium]|nr:hypothetical protein [Frankiales bacterium]
MRLLSRAAAAAVLALLPLLAAAPAGAAAPVATGWWSFATMPGLPVPPSPPDVGEGDLLLQAGDPSGLSAGSTDATPAPSAVAALRFDLPPGSAVGPLTLTVADGAAASDVRAYVTRDDWEPASGAPLAEAPVADRSRYSLGVLDGTRLVFADVGRLLPEEGPLSLVLLPGVADRVVVRRPGADALAVTAPPATAPSTAPTAAPAPPASTAAAADAAPPVVPDVVPGDPEAPLPEPVAGAPDVAVAAPDAAAPAPAAAPAVAPVTAPAVAAPLPVPAALDDTRTRYLAAAELALVLLTFAMLRGGPLAGLVGGATPAAEEGAARVRGVGRFAKERSGRVVRL